MCYKVLIRECGRWCAVGLEHFTVLDATGAARRDYPGRKFLVVPA